ncbi:MAG: thrS 1 [Chloroflexi bacterium]|nr:thrS 1 [Chloroflexota bacterium]
MRLLIFHVDSFACTITRKGRSPISETPSTPTCQIGNGLLVLASAEAGDEADLESVSVGAAHEVEDLAKQLKVGEVMLMPFAHLFADPAPAPDALRLIEEVAAQLRGAGLAVEQPPFGWFHTWEMRAKGHPLARVARTIRPVPHAS